MPPAGFDRSAYSIEYSGVQQVDLTLSEQEITAWMNTNRPGYWPFSDVQVRIHPNNMLEASFYLDTAKLLTDRGVMASLPQEMKGYLSQAPGQVPVYAEARVTFTGPRQTAVEVISLSAMGMKLTGMVDAQSVNKALGDALNEVLAQASPVNVQIFNTLEGYLWLKGEWYAEIKRVPVK
jgi:hypothetical protein